MNNLKYFILTSFRRQQIDKDLNKNKDKFKGRILDIGGGRQRGKFIFPKKAKVTFVDISSKLKPDVIASVEKLPFKKEKFDVVKATELFEHVENPEKGINECIRVLKKGGHFIITMPFLYPVHADPFDFQRWTEKKLKDVLKDNNLKILDFKIQGYYFSVLADFIKIPVLHLPFLIRYLVYLIILPLSYFLLFIDKKIDKSNKILNKYHQGYFIFCKKA